MERWGEIYLPSVKAVAGLFVPLPLNLPSVFLALVDGVEPLRLPGGRWPAILARERHA